MTPNPIADPSRGMPRPAHAAARPVTALTINVKAFQGSDGGEVDERAYDAIAKYIKQADPDVIMLQELDQGTGRAHGQDTLAEIARRVGATDTQFAKAIDHDGGRYGIGLMTRKGASIPDRPDGTNQHTVVRLPKSDDPAADREQRVALVAPVELPDGGRFTAISTHATTKAAGRSAQLDALRAVAIDAKDGSTGRGAGLPDDLPRTVVMAGDFNTRQPNIDRHLRGSGVRHVNDRVDGLGMLGIDHMYVSDNVEVRSAQLDQPAVIDRRRWWNPFDDVRATDHPALLAHLLIRGS